MVQSRRAYEETNVMKWVNNAYGRLFLPWSIANIMHKNDTNMNVTSKSKLWVIGQFPPKKIAPQP